MRRAEPLLQDDSFTAKSQPRRKRNPAQLNLAFDPMPQRVEPCLALLERTAPTGP
jgi:bifunctional non-homologous end joining protein LigD